MQAIPQDSMDFERMQLFEQLRKMEALFIQNCNFKIE